MAVPMSDDEREAAGALLRTQVPAAAGIGGLFARHGHELALVGGLIRDVFLGQQPTGDFDLATDATPEQVMALVSGWADATWAVGIAFGTIGLRKGGTVFEITTYRSEQYRSTSRKPDVRYGHSLVEDLSRRDFTVNAMAARLPLRRPTVPKAIPIVQVASAQSSTTARTCSGVASVVRSRSLGSSLRNTSRTGPPTRASW